VGAEQGILAQGFLTDASNLMSKLSGVIPSLELPEVSVGISAARYLLSTMNENRTLLDYQVQFYSANDVTQSGGSPLGIFRRGQWAVVGRPKLRDADFWAEPLSLNRQTLQIVDSQNKSVEVPYVLTTILTSDLQVPTLVMARSHNLSKIIEGKNSNDDLSLVKNAGNLVAQSLESYVAIRGFNDTKSFAGLNEVVRAISSLKDKVSTATDSSMESLMQIVQAVAPPGTKLDTPEDIFIWWNDVGKLGTIVSDPDHKNRFGVKWQAPPPKTPSLTSAVSPPQTQARQQSRSDELV
jgi:hypothetical protein